MILFLDITAYRKGDFGIFRVVGKDCDRLVLVASFSGRVKNSPDRHGFSGSNCIFSGNNGCTTATGFGFPDDQFRFPRFSKMKSHFPFSLGLIFPKESVVSRKWATGAFANSSGLSFEKSSAILALTERRFL